MKTPLLSILILSVILFSCKKNEFDKRPIEKILDGQSVRNWQITAIINSATSEDLYDSLLADCEKDDFYAFYDDNKFEIRDNDIVCVLDSSTDVIEEGVWNVTTDDIYFDILSSKTLTHEEYMIIEVSTTSLIVEDSLNTRFTFTPM